MSVHSVVSEINKTLQSFENAESYMESIEENGNIKFHLDESFPTLFQGFKITAKRTRIRNLREIAAFNVAKYISSENDVKKLKIPSSLYKLITVFLDTYSGDYKTAWNKKGNLEITKKDFKEWKPLTEIKLGIGTTIKNIEDSI